MKIFGYFVLVVGLVWMGFAFSMNTSVSTEYGKINNIGLMAAKQNHIIVGGIITICGVLVSIFCKSSFRYNSFKCPLCSETVSHEAKKCKHCGSDITPIKNKAISKEDSAPITLEPYPKPLIAVVAIVMVVIVSILLIHKI